MGRSAPGVTVPAIGRDETPAAGETGQTDQSLIADRLRRITVYPNRLVLELRQSCGDRRTDGLTPGDTFGLASGNASGPTQTITAPWSPRQKRPRQEIAEDQCDAPGGESAHDERCRLAHTIHTGRIWLAELASGSSANLDAIATRECKHVRTIHSTIALAFLAPDIVERLISQGLPQDWTIADITRRLPRYWNAQRRMLSG